MSPVEAQLRQVHYAARDGFLGARRGHRVELRDGSGRVGVGEALPLPAAGTETLAECSAALGRVVARLRATRPHGAEEVRDLCEAARLDLRSATPAAAFAIDAATHDLLGDGAPDLGRPPRRRVRVNAVVTAPSSAGLCAAERLVRHEGFTTLKLKVGRGGLEEDEAWLAAIRERIGSGPRLRIDPNGAWSPDEALRRLERLFRFDLEYCEQPVPTGDLDGLRRVAASSPVPVAADEALACPKARDEIVAGRVTPFVVLKPMVLGGLTEATSLARDAHERGLRCVVTTTFEGPPGCAAAAWLAAAWGDASLAHGIAGPDQLETAFPTWLQPRRGEIRTDPGSTS